MFLIMVRVEVLRWVELTVLIQTGLLSGLLSVSVLDVSHHAEEAFIGCGWCIVGHYVLSPEVKFDPEGPQNSLSPVLLLTPDA